ncbi:MAG: hypothetical protein U0930_12930 [Pirellulales bacterium]
MIQLRKLRRFARNATGCSLALVLGAAVPLTLAKEPGKSDDPKPTSPETKTGEGGVSINLKLVPPPKLAETPKKESEPQASAKDEKSKDTKQSESAKSEKPQAKAEPKSNDKPTGSVELKLIPPKPPEPEKKVEPNPTGSVAMSLVLPKEKPQETGSGRVTIELTPVKPNVETAKELGEPIDEPTTNDEDINKELKVDDAKGNDLKKTPKAGSKTQITDLKSDKSKPTSTKPNSKTRGGDPGDPGDDEVAPLPTQPGDLPLVQEAHPFDAPAAKATKEESRFSKSKKLADISDSDQQRNQRISDVLEYYKTHQENVVRRGPWALMHTILPYGVETEIIAGKQKVNAIGWLCHNGISAKQRMFQPTQTGFRTNVGPGVQGHEGQFLAILAQSHVHRDYPLQIGNKKYTINDLIKYEMATCREKTELTFKLIGFAHYLEPNQTWKDNRGRPWSIEKLVAEELAQPINGEACGGTHRLMGLTCAVVSRQEAGLPLTGHFERAEKFLNSFIEYTFTLQNPDGSFSTEWFERRGDEQNVDRKVQTTGHIVEWLIYTLPDDHLRSPEVEKAVDFLLNTVGKNPSKDWAIGPRGHSLRALDLYQKRVYKGQEISTDTNLAKPPGKSIQR